MILSCPRCATRFEVPASALGTKGRKVRCTACHHIWFAQAEPSAAASANRAPDRPAVATGSPGEQAAQSGTRTSEPAVKPAAAALPGAGEPVAERAEPPGYAVEGHKANVGRVSQQGRAELGGARPTADGAATRKPSDTPIQPKTRSATAKPASASLPKAPPNGLSTWGTVGWMLLSLLIIAAAGIVVGRNEIVAAYPDMAPHYQRLGLPVVLKPQLELRDIASERAFDQGVSVVVVKGTIANLSDRPQDVPRVRVALLDTNREEVAHEFFEADASSLGPHGSVEFSARIVNPPRAASNFSVRLANDS